MYLIRFSTFIFRPWSSALFPLILQSETLFTEEEEEKFWRSLSSPYTRLHASLWPLTPSSRPLCVLTPQTFWILPYDLVSPPDPPHLHSPRYFPKLARSSRRWHRITLEFAWMKSEDVSQQNWHQTLWTFNPSSQSLSSITYLTPPTINLWMLPFIIPFYFYLFMCLTFVMSQVCRTKDKISKCFFQHFMSFSKKFNLFFQNFKFWFYHFKLITEIFWLNNLKVVTLS